MEEGLLIKHSLRAGYCAEYVQGSLSLKNYLWEAALAKFLFHRWENWQFQDHTARKEPSIRNSIQISSNYRICSLDHHHIASQLWVDG